PRPPQRAFSGPGLCTLVAFVAVLSSVAAAEATRTLFDIPASSAEKSLRRFSSQSGLQVIFPTAAVRGVRTQALHGEFTIREALERLLASTPLQVVQDDRTGALTVIRQEDAAPPVDQAR